MYGARDSYSVPLALEQEGMLDSLFTDFYSPDVLARKIAYFRKRHADGLPWAKSRSLFVRFKTLQAAARLRGADHYRLVAETDRMLGRAAVQHARRNGVGIVSYNWHWPGVTEDTSLAAHVSPRVLIQIHPIAAQVREILAHDREATGIDFAPDAEELYSRQEVEDYNRTLQMADCIIAPCRFVRTGLTSAGVWLSRIAIIPLGATLPLLPGAEDLSAVRDRRLRLLFVGQLVQRKGVHHLFAALKSIPQSAYSLTMVCRSVPDPVLKKMVPEHADLRPGVSAKELAALYRESDLFVMPSLVEGFGIVYAEALAHGLPIVCTENTGMADLVTDGVDGFVVQVGNREALAALLDRCISDPKGLLAMRRQAVALASLCSWSRFRRELRETMRALSSGTAG